MRIKKRGLAYPWSELEETSATEIFVVENLLERVDEWLDGSEPFLLADYTSEQEAREYLESEAARRGLSPAPEDKDSFRNPTSDRRIEEETWPEHICVSKYARSFLDLVMATSSQGPLN